MYKHSSVTEQIIKAFYYVYNELGHGFLEKVYENALVIQVRKQGLLVRQQAPIKVYFDAQIVGIYFADLLVDNKVIVEIKVAEGLCDEHEAPAASLSEGDRNRRRTTAKLRTKTTSEEEDLRDCANAN